MTSPSAERRPLGKTKLMISPVSLGTWPMAGVTSVGVSDQDSIATLRACLGSGVNFIDTAYCYGPNGESENLVRRALAEVRDEIVLATKCGIHYNAAGEQVQDARPEAIVRECDESLRRLGTDRVELYYLHSPDPQVPVEESAGAIRQLIDDGKVLCAGASNCHLNQLQAFHAICPLSAVQLPYNMLQRGIEQQTLPWCREQGISMIVYWALMKGLLAGRLSRDHQFDPQDARLRYPMYQGEEWLRNQAFVDSLRTIAQRCERTVAEVVVNWTIQQPGITAALCGAKQPWQLEETAGAMGWQLTPGQRTAVDAALAARGEAAGKRDFQ